MPALSKLKPLTNSTKSVTLTRVARTYPPSVFPLIINMLAARDQENVTHSHLVTAAAKPLNQGRRCLQPKTPGGRASKTPFRLVPNNENLLIGFSGQKAGVKNIGIAGENVPQTPKDLKQDRNAFITPQSIYVSGWQACSQHSLQCAVPRIRAPLGLKTTNAKAQTFQTPAAAQETLDSKTTNGKLLNKNNAVSTKTTYIPPGYVEPGILVAQDDEYVSDIEYAPPPPKDLPDPPMEFPYDDTFPQFRDTNLCRSYPWPETKNQDSLFGVKEHKVNSQYHERIKGRMTRPQPAKRSTNNSTVSQIARRQALQPEEGLLKDNMSTVQIIPAGPLAPHTQCRTSNMTLSGSSLEKKSKKKPAFSVLKSKEASTQSEHLAKHRSTTAEISRNHEYQTECLPITRTVSGSDVVPDANIVRHSGAVQSTNSVQQTETDHPSTPLEWSHGLLSTLPEVYEGPLMRCEDESVVGRFDNWDEVAEDCLATDTDVHVEEQKRLSERDELSCDLAGTGSDDAFRGEKEVQSAEDYEQADNVRDLLGPLEWADCGGANSEVRLSKYHELANALLDLDFSNHDEEEVEPGK